MNPKSKAFVVSLLAIMTNTVREMKEVPAGHLYAALMSHGVTLSAYYALETMLCARLKIKKIGDVLYWTAEAETLLNSEGDEKHDDQGHA